MNEDTGDEIRKKDTVGNATDAYRANDINNAMDGQIILNPYYEGEVEMMAQDNTKSDVIPDWNATEAVTKVDNIYYQI